MLLFNFPIRWYLNILNFFEYFDDVKLNINLMISIWCYYLVFLNCHIYPNTRSVVEILPDLLMVGKHWLTYLMKLCSFRLALFPVLTKPGTHSCPISRRVWAQARLDVTSSSKETSETRLSPNILSAPRNNLEVLDCLIICQLFLGERKKFIHWKQ